MKAVCWYGAEDVRVEGVPDPQILNPHDAIVKVTLTAICGSDLHLYDGYIPTREKGDILGHEFMSDEQVLFLNDIFPSGYQAAENCNIQGGDTVDKMPMGVAFGKGLTLKMGQTQVQRYLRPLLDKIDGGEVDPSYIITHRMKLADAVDGYKISQEKSHNCIKVVMTP